MLPRRPLAALLCLLWLALPTTAWAGPPLSDRVPADALVYFGWAGADGCPGYDGSHLNGVVAASSIPQLFASFVPQVVRRVGGMDGQAGEVLDQIVAAGSPMWRHPSAVYVGPVDYSAPKPRPRVAVLCEAGADAAALADNLKGLLSNLPRSADPRPAVRTYGGLVVLSLGIGDDDLAHAPAVALSSAVTFTDALAQCRPAGAAMVGYVDVQAIVAAVDDGVRRSGNPTAVAKWPTLRDALGLGGFRRVALTAGFEGRDWVEREFDSTDGSHTGLLSLADGRPLDTDVLAVVPRTADRVSAARLDLAAGFDALQNAIASVDPDTATKVDHTIAQVDRAAGVNVRRDLLGSLGDQWVTYSDRAIGGSSVLGSVLVNHLRDPARADAAMTQVSRRLNFIVARQMHNPNVEIQFREQAVNGTTLHYLAVPLVTPTWAVKDGNLYVGVYPQVVSAAIDAAARHGRSILQRPEYIALMRRLGDHPAASISFTNLPAVAPDGYTDLLGTSRLLLGLGDIFGAHPPVLVVPPLQQVLNELEPAGTQTWADAAGWHSMTISPFPGAEVLAAGNTGGGGLSQLPILMSVIGQAMRQGQLFQQPR